MINQKKKDILKVLFYRLVLIIPFFIIINTSILLLILGFDMKDGNVMKMVDFMSEKMGL